MAPLGYVVLALLIVVATVTLLHQYADFGITRCSLCHERHGAIKRWPR